MCERLGVSPAELASLDYETVAIHLAYLEGKELALWVAANPRPTHDDR